MTPHELTEARQIEREKYDRIYQNPRYKMGSQRYTNVVSLLKERPDLDDSLLDVSCGRGELMRAAWSIGIRRVAGAEVVKDLLWPNDKFFPVVFSNAWFLEGHNSERKLADESFETVLLLDTLEHLLPDDALASIVEVARVAKRRVIFTASNVSSAYRRSEVGELHINRRPYEDWDQSFRELLPGWEIKWRKDKTESVSNYWEAIR